MQHTLNVHPITGNAGQFINVETAQAMIATWQQVTPQGIFSILYGRHVLDTILSVPECAGVRIYNGLNAENKQAFVFIGALTDGTTLMNDFIWDLGAPCPPRCGHDNPKLMYLWRQPIDPTINMQQIGKNITLKTGREMVTRWQQQQPAATGSFLFKKEVLEAILNVPGCEGFVVYNGINAEGAQTLIVLPADAAGRCMVNYTVILPEGTQLADAPVVSGGIPEQVIL